MDGADARVTLRAAHVEAILDPAAGGRIATLRVDDLALLVTERNGPLSWGAYPMVPWAGRLRDGTFEFAGEVHLMARTMPPHAIHGTTWDRPWRVTAAGPSEATLEIGLAPDWPLGGRAIHRVAVHPDRLTATLEVHAADRPMPAIVGWHPWFPRQLARGGPVELDLRAAGMLIRGPDGLPTGTIIPPPPGPWDDTFVDLAAAPVVRWPGAIEVAVQADVPFWVIYTEHQSGICVEPQTGPPNGLATGACFLVQPGRPLIASMTLAWRRLDASTPPA